MKRKDAIECIMKSLDGSEAVISSLGLLSRELYENFDSERNFYMVGSMGLASSIGLGAALNKPQKRIVVIDGEGSLLMNLGSMATIGNLSPRNLTHIVLDNNAYASSTEEPSVSITAKLDEIARVVGYKNVYRVNNHDNLYTAINEFPYDGSNFILTEIELGGNRDPKRPLNLKKVKEKFKNFLCRPPENSQLLSCR